MKIAVKVTGIHNPVIFWPAKSRYFDNETVLHFLIKHHKENRNKTINARERVLHNLSAWNKWNPMFFTPCKSPLTARFTIQLNSVVNRKLKLKLQDSKATICAVFLIVWCQNFIWKGLQFRYRDKLCIYLFKKTFVLLWKISAFIGICVLGWIKNLD